MALAELRAGDVMAPDTITVAEHESLAAAWEVLARAGCRFLPVMRGHRLVGVIDDHAVVVARSTKWLDGRPRLVGDAATPAHTVRRDTPLVEVLGHLSEAAGSALVVVDEQGGPVGILTADRVVGLIDQALDCAGVGEQ
jgi:acetoin utilization protein AcuB